jgi:hypothetical protein
MKMLPWGKFRKNAPNQILMKIKNLIKMKKLIKVVFEIEKLFFNENQFFNHFFVIKSCFLI